MSYRSDVKLITTREGWERIRKEVRKLGVDEKYSLVSGVGEPICAGKYVLAEWDSVKWYEGRDEEVDAIMRELRKFDVEHIPYQYLRVGEDWGDNDYFYERDWKSKDYDDMPDLVLERTIELRY